MKDTKSKEFTPNQVEAQKRDAEARKGLELRDAEIVLAKPNRKVKVKKGKKVRKEKQALIRARKREESHMLLLSKGWDRQRTLEAALKGLSDILEQRERNIEKHTENLKASQGVLAARKLHAADTRKVLEEQGKQPQQDIQDQ